MSFKSVVDKLSCVYISSNNDILDEITCQLIILDWINEKDPNEDIRIKKFIDDDNKLLNKISTIKIKNYIRKYIKKMPLYIIDQQLRDLYISSIKKSDILNPCEYF